MPDHEHDDPLHDVMAAVTAVRADDTEGLAAVMAYGCPGHMLIITLKLLAEALDDYGVPAEGWREWARHAVNRP